MKTASNLKLRESEDMSSKVITIMKEKTAVIILEIGKTDTIDGITSPWVKVSVDNDAYDIYQTPIKPGTEGWCFGGYLN